MKTQRHKEKLKFLFVPLCETSLSQSMRQPCINPVSINPPAFTNTPHTQRQTLHVLYINLQRTRANTLPQLLPITKHRKLNLRPVVINQRREVFVSSIQLKFNLRIRRHADAVDVSIQLRLSPARRQTHRIEIGKKHLRRLDLFQRERKLRSLFTERAVLPDTSHFRGVRCVRIEPAQGEGLRR